MARQRALAARGRRTGVQTSLSQRPLSQEPEDIDEVFDGAGTPNERENRNNEQSSMTTNVDAAAANKDKNNKKKGIRFSLESTTTAVSRDEGDDDASLRRTAAQRLQRKLRGSRGSLSPSELSRVSTAPPSVKRSAQHEEEEEEDIEQVRHSSTEMQDILRSTTTTPLAQDHQEQDDFDVASPGSPLPEANDYEEEEEDNFLPPPPESPAHEDDEQDPSQDEVPTQVDHSPVDFPTQLDDDDDDDDKEGEGFSMAESPVGSTSNPKTRANTESDDDEEPQEPEEHVTKKKQPSNKKKKTHKSTKKRTAPPIDDDDDESSQQVKPAKKPRKKKAKEQTRQTPFSPKGIQAGPIQFRAIPVTREKDIPPEEANLRRSKRTHIRPLAWWKGEKAEYGHNTFPDEIAQQGNEDMAEVKCYLVAEPTPYKPRKPRAPVTRKDTSSSSKKKGKAAAARHQEEEDGEFDSSNLRKKYSYMDSDSAYLWDDNWEQADHMSVVMFKGSEPERELPRSRRKKNESKAVGSATQAFNVVSSHQLYPGYLMGSLRLPPTAIKDAESVGYCAQTFTVVSAQTNAIEVAYSHPDEDAGTFNRKTAQRFLLSSGDMFRIPPGNCYQIQNHSSTQEAMLTWTIIRPNRMNGYYE